jgi:hypothetical protein
VEAVELHELTGQIGLDVARRQARRRRRPGQRRVAGDKAEPLAAGVQTMAAQHLENAARRDLQLAPHRLRQLEGNAPRTEARVAERERDHPLFQPGRYLVRHSRHAAFPWPQHFQTLALNLSLQPVVAGAVVAEFAAGATDTNLAGSREKVHAQPEEQVIIGHRRLLLRSLDNPRMGRFFMSGNASQVSLYLGSCAV